MTSTKQPEFTIKDFCKYILKCWPIMAICVALGCAIAVYSYKSQFVSYSSTASIMVHDNSYEYGGTLSPYAQIIAILQSKEAFEDAGVDVKDVDFGNITISERSTGVFDLKDSNSDKEKATSDLNKVVKNAEKVIAKAYDNEKQYRVTNLKTPGDPVAVSTQKDKLFSSVLIVAISAFVAVAIDFIGFNKKSEA